LLFLHLLQATIPQQLRQPTFQSFQRNSASILEYNNGILNGRSDSSRKQRHLYLVRGNGVIRPIINHQLAVKTQSYAVITACADMVNYWLCA